MVIEPLNIITVLRFLPVPCQIERVSPLSSIQPKQTCQCSNRKTPLVIAIHQLNRINESNTSFFLALAKAFSHHEQKQQRTVTKMATSRNVVMSNQALFESVGIEGELCMDRIGSNGGAFDYYCDNDDLLNKGTFSMEDGKQKSEGMKNKRLRRISGFQSTTSATTNVNIVSPQMNSRTTDEDTVITDDEEDTMKGDMANTSTRMDTSSLWGGDDEDDSVSILDSLLDRIINECEAQKSERRKPAPAVARTSQGSFINDNSKASTDNKVLLLQVVQYHKMPSSQQQQQQQQIASAESPPQQQDDHDDEGGNGAVVDTSKQVITTQRHVLFQNQHTGSTSFSSSYLNPCHYQSSFNSMPSLVGGFRQRPLPPPPDLPDI